MRKLKSSLKYFRLTFVFAGFVFVVILATMLIVVAGVHLLASVGIIEGNTLEHFPLFLFSVASLLIGTLLAALSSKVLLGSIRELISATDKIADGDYSVRLDFKKGPEEIRMLGVKFNRMAEELGSVEMLRSDFVSNFSHEFKTPIVSIRGFAKALKWDDLTEQEREEYLDIIIDESERLSSLSANVLYLSKIEKQTILTDKKKFNVSEQIRLVIALLDKKLAEKQLEVIFDSGEVYFTANEEMLKQVWINLLDNAIKFSPIYGKVDIKIAEQNGKVILSFTNQGEGISQEAAAHIFDKFYQGDTSHATKGNGLGLTIAKKIIELHKGNIYVDYLNNGLTTFKVELFS